MSKKPRVRFEDLAFWLDIPNSDICLGFQHHVRGTVCEIYRLTDLVNFGVAWRNPLDEFNVRTGELVSLRKATRCMCPSDKKMIFDAYFESKRETENATRTQSKG